MKPFEFWDKTGRIFSLSHNSGIIADDVKTGMTVCKHESNNNILFFGYSISFK
jgi:hypothetical protein